jgi:hypothetical protein
MSYREIALAVRDWTETHSLRLTTCWVGVEALCADFASIDGQNFRIWIDPPLNGVTGIHMICVEGWRQNDPHRNWIAETADVREALEEALSEVVKQMEQPFSLVPQQRAC